MVTMNISLPEKMKLWVEAQAETGSYSNSSDYVRDLIRRDQERAEKIAAFQKLVDDGLASGVSDLTVDDIWPQGVEPTATRNEISPLRGVRRGHQENTRS